MSQELDEQLTGSFPAIPKQERAQQKRKALMESGRILFAENGYEQTTAKEIASHADVATGTFYRYFSDKRQLLMALLEDKIDKVIPPEPKWINCNPEYLLASIIEQHINDLKDLGLYRVLPELLSRDPEFREVLSEAKSKLYERIFLGLLLAKEKKMIWQDLNLDTLTWAIMTLLEKAPDRLLVNCTHKDYLEISKVICRLVLPPDQLTHENME